MKKFQLFSFIGMVAFTAAFIAGCGQQNTNPAAYNYGYGVNGAQTGYYNTGYNNPYYNGFNSGYSGYWNNGQAISVQGTVYQAQIQVQAGQQINTTRYQWGAMIKCDRKLIDTYDNKLGGYITNAVVTMNGQALQQVATGVYVSSVAGVALISADLNALSSSIRCGTHGDRPYQIMSYWVRQY